MSIDRDELRAYATRPWAEIERAKREYIATRYREDPVAHAASVADLAAHLRALRPEWPTAEELAADFADHVALKRTLDHVAAVLDARRR